MSPTRARREPDASQRDENELRRLQRRVAFAALMLLCVFVVGVVGYRIIGSPEHGWLDAMHGHFFGCGAGQTGTSVIRELTTTDRECVAIEHSHEHVAALSRVFPQLAVLHGDCSDDETLTKAGVQCAAGIVVCTDDDKNALVTTGIARQLTPNVRAVARATSDKAASRLRQAGADGVVSPAQIGGMRLASELIRPSVVSFLDQMLRDTNKNLRLEDVAPPAATRVKPGSHLIAMGDPVSVQHLRAVAAPETAKS